MLYVSFNYGAADEHCACRENSAGHRVGMPERGTMHGERACVSCGACVHEKDEHLCVIYFLSG